MQRTLAQGLLRMAAGQHADLAMANGADTTPDAVQAAVAGKTGEEMATAAALAAHFAGAPAAVAAYARLGRALGTAAQLGSDCRDLFGAMHSKDLASGTRTLPIALHLARLTGGERVAFLALLDAARTDAEAGRRVREALLASGALRRCAFTVELHCQRAYRAIEEAAPLEPARAALRGCIAGCSFFAAGVTRPSRAPADRSGWARRL